MGGRGVYDPPMFMGGRTPPVFPKATEPQESLQESSDGGEVAGKGTPWGLRDPSCMKKHLELWTRPFSLPGAVS